MPLVSVIIATYNRSNVLTYTIQSLLRSSFCDWELIVVGDACTDDTEEVVLGFNDRRIRFKNLEENVGDQCGPNNEGIRMAKGQYIAFLSHDDLWMPNHLDICLREIQESDADFVYPLGLIIWTDEKNRVFAFDSNPKSHHTWLPASFWFFKRELAQQIGPWRHYSECLMPPSQDWLFRVRKAGKTIRMIPEVTVVAIVATGRAGVYERRDYLENKQYFERMCQEPGFLENELTKVAIYHAKLENSLAVWPPLRKGLTNAVLKVARCLGMEPFKVRFALSYGGKGSFIKRFHKDTGAHGPNKPKIDK